jgi:putative spermidine/putrescine transport system ATP-binding protein
MQLDRPETLYQRPANAFVAGFVGFENLIPLTVTQRDGAQVTAGAEGGAALTLSQDRLGPIPDRFTLATRPEGLRVTADPAVAGLPAELGLRTYLGRSYQYQTTGAAGRLLASGPLSQPFDPGMTVRLVPNPDHCAILPPE